MQDSALFNESKVKERRSLSFVETIFKYAGYEVVHFGIENHYSDLMKQIGRSNYKSETARKLLTMPDLIVMDNKKQCWLVEVKHRNIGKNFDYKKTNFPFHKGQIQDYAKFWRNAILIITLDIKPYCLCVDINKINKNNFKREVKDNYGKLREEWNFCGNQEIINKKFKITNENFSKARKENKIGS